MLLIFISLLFRPGLQETKLNADAVIILYSIY